MTESNEEEAAAAVLSEMLRKPFNQATVEIMMSLSINFPGMREPVYIDGMRIRVDAYMYDMYKQNGALDGWLHAQAVHHVLTNSKIQGVVIVG